MHADNSVVAIFGSHDAAEAAVKKLIAGGLGMKNLSVVGKGYHSDEKVIGFYADGDRIRFWGTRGAFWGELWALFLGGMFLTVPFIGNVVVLGDFATILISAIGKAAVGGELSVLGAGFFCLGIPKNIIIEYESAIRADSFVVMACGDADQMVQANEILASTSASRIDVHLAPATRDAPVACTA